MRSRGWRLVLAVVAISAVTELVGQTPGPPVDLAPGQPDALGFSVERLGRLDRTLQQVAEKEFGLEVPFTMDNVESATALSASPTSRALATSMSSAWIAFARSGAPAAKTLPAWPKYTSRDRATMLLDDHPRVVSDPFGERSVWEGVPLT